MRSPKVPVLERPEDFPSSWDCSPVDQREPPLLSAPTMRMILTGVLFIIGGASGSLVLRGTGSSGALALVGVVMLVIGVVQLASGGNQPGPSEGFADVERDREQMEEYERTKARIAEAQRQQPISEEAKALIAKTPGADAEIKELVKRTKDHLTTEQVRALVLETAQRLHADHRRKQQAAGV